MIDPSVKIFIGPMSKNVVDTIIDFNANNNRIGLIPSRRQVEYNGGYVNNWTTRSFAEYVTSQNPTILLERDHGGPSQGYQDDDGEKSYETDARYLDIIHIDPWEKHKKYEDGLKATINGINICHSINPACYYEVGTEETIRHFKVEELDAFISDLKKILSEKVFSRIKYAVIQSGVGLNLGKKRNTGKFDPKRLQAMVNVCRKYHLYSKEHNGDYLTLPEIKVRFELGLDAINIAPEFGQLETDMYLGIIDKLHGAFFEDFYRICYKSKRWEKWVQPGFNVTIEKEKVIRICGHYIFSNPEFIDLKDKMAGALGITVSQIDEKIREKIKNNLVSLEFAINETFGAQKKPKPMIAGMTGQQTGQQYSLPIKTIPQRPTCSRHHTHKK